MPRVLICEDDPRFRALLVKTIVAAEGLLVVGQAGSGEEACALLADGLAADVLLLDLELPGISGLDVIRQLAGAPSRPEILVLTTFADEARVFEAVRGGAAGYLVKGVAPRQLVAAVGEVLAGGTVIEPRLARRFWNLFASVQGRGGDDRGLTAEELEVLALVARGLSNPDAALALGASRREIKSHLESIYRKLGVAGRVEAAVAALQAGLIAL